MNTIFVGTRAMALADGILVDVSNITQKGGISFPVAVTESLYQILKTIPEDTVSSLDSRIQNLLMDGLIVLLAKKHTVTSPLLYKYQIESKAGCDPEILNICLVLDSDDDGEPIATVGLADSMISLVGGQE